MAFHIIAWSNCNITTHLNDGLAGLYCRGLRLRSLSLAQSLLTLRQDHSAKYDSMPRSAAAAGCVDFVLSPEYIAKELTRIAQHPYVAGPLLDGASPEDDWAVATAHENDESSLIAGGVVVVIRLHDARLTARTVRYRIEQKSQAEINAIRHLTDDLGWWTNCLIPVQFIAFALAAIIFLIWVLLSFSAKLD